MSVHFKICVDCADPHLLADFWAEALGYVVRDDSSLIERLLAQGHIGEELLVEIDGRKAWKTAAAISAPADPAAPQDDIGQGRLMLFQSVPESKLVKNRMHLDLHFGLDRIEAEADRLERLGAKRLGTGEEGPSRWIVMADPEGNEFCVHS